MESFYGFMYGAFGGTVGLVMSHPIDTIKTCVQSNKPVPRNIISLYRGVLPPLFGMSLEKAIVFGTYEYCKNNGLSTYLSGAISGFTASLVVTPYERLKIIRQSGSVLTKTDFLPNTLWRGLSATFTREVPGFAIYFSTYETLKNKFYPDHNSITGIGSMILGASAGSVAWLFIYPQDVIKTRMQSDKSKIGFVQTVNQIMKESGFRGFLKGFHFALMRAMPLHAGTFFGVETLKTFMN